MTKERVTVVQFVRTFKNEQEQIDHIKKIRARVLQELKEKSQA